MEILALIYIIAGYWSVGQTIYYNKVIIEFKFGTVFLRKLIIGCMFGFVLIPLAIILKILRAKNS